MLHVLQAEQRCCSTSLLSPPLSCLSLMTARRACFPDSMFWKFVWVHEIFIPLPALCQYAYLFTRFFFFSKYLCRLWIVPPGCLGWRIQRQQWWKCADDQNEGLYLVEPTIASSWQWGWHDQWFHLVDGQLICKVNTEGQSGDEVNVISYVQRFFSQQEGMRGQKLLSLPEGVLQFVIVLSLEFADSIKVWGNIYPFNILLFLCYMLTSSKKTNWMSTCKQIHMLQHVEGINQDSAHMKISNGMQTSEILWEELHLGIALSTHFQFPLLFNANPPTSVFMLKNPGEKGQHTYDSPRNNRHDRYTSNIRNHYSEVTMKQGWFPFQLQVQFGITQGGKTNKRTRIEVTNVGNGKERPGIIAFVFHESYCV